MFINNVCVCVCEAEYSSGANGRWLYGLKPGWIAGRQMVYLLLYIF